MRATQGSRTSGLLGGRGRSECAEASRRPLIVGTPSAAEKHAAFDHGCSHAVREEHRLPEAERRSGGGRPHLSGEEAKHGLGLGGVLTSRSTVVGVHDRAKQGAAIGYTKVRRYHPQLATCAQTGQVMMSWLRGGSAGAPGVQPRS